MPWGGCASCLCAGLVFLAFAFNMVDCGGLLGGRLGDARPRKVRALPLAAAKRTFTL